jgi:hypothetical protein
MTLKKMENWIHIEEFDTEYAEPSRSVLVSCKRGIKIGRRFGCGNWWDDNLNLLNDVTHFMELPKAVLKYKWKDIEFHSCDINRISYSHLNLTKVEVGFKKGITLEINFDSEIERKIELEKIQNLWR